MRTPSQWIGAALVVAVTSLWLILGSSGPAAAVDILARKAEAESMNLGSPGQTMVVQGPPTIKTTTTACDGKTGAYPIQSALVFDEESTHISSVIVCSPEGLSPGEMITPALVLGDHPTEGDLEYTRYEGVVIPSTPAVPGIQSRAGVTRPKRISSEVRTKPSKRLSREHKDPAARDLAGTLTTQARSDGPPLQAASTLSSRAQTEHAPTWRPWRLTVLVFILVLIPPALFAIRKRPRSKSR